ncbi:MAG TPA: zinc-dependent peptidase [Catalimonadaceae bacterium]|nr:zinc-dependent peptidase [Catalimonadaceae bacterium]
MFTIIFLTAAGGLFLFYFKRKKNVFPPQTILEDLIPIEVLEREIHFYSRLSEIDKKQFRDDLFDFLNRVRIVGVGTEVSAKDRLFVASSAVIPVFHFPQWQYYELDEVLLFESAINLNFQTRQTDSQIIGLVGTGKLERKMILTREALEDGFSNKTDRFNVGIHEFIHLIDKEDGQIDGLPKVLMDKQYAIPWLRHIRSKILEIHYNQSDIDAYGATNLSEFLAVSGEYFFERPDLFKIKHPELYHMMDQMFRGRQTG